MPPYLVNLTSTGHHLHPWAPKLWPIQPQIPVPPSVHMERLVGTLDLPLSTIDAGSATSRTPSTSVMSSKLIFSLKNFLFLNSLAPTISNKLRKTCFTSYKAPMLPLSTTHSPLVHPSSMPMRKWQISFVAPSNLLRSHLSLLRWLPLLHQ